MPANYQLRTAVIVQLLGDPEFYARNVAFLYLREQGLAAVKKYLAAVAGGTGDGCCGGAGDDRKIMDGVTSAFLRTAIQLHQLSGASGLKDLRQFLEGKLGPLGEITLTFATRTGNQQEVKF